ncbi:MAG: glycosyltransferase family 1 protein [Oscillibacter sp.]|nr:glycosyltransferase family 1 protein [Oscillibacter sp.]
MKILHLASPGLGGIETYIFSHYKYMDQREFRFDFMTQNAGLRDAEEFRNFRFDVKLLHTAAGKDPEGFKKRVREILLEGYDVLHLHTCYWTGFSMEEVAREVGIKKVIVHSHSTFIDEADPEKRQMLFKRHEEIKRIFSPELATDFWACSWKAAGWLFGEQIPKEKIKIMKNAIELERFQFNPQTRERVRQELGLQNAMVLGTVGRLSYTKNHAFLISLLSEFQKEHANAKLMIIGGGEMRKELEKQVLECGLEGKVLLLGWKSEVENYLQAMDCFLLPSRFEGNPISLIEAAAAGLPAIISDTITEEAVFTDSIQRLPLAIPSWLSALEKTVNQSVERARGLGVLRAGGYDIRQQAKRLEMLYRN